MSEVTNRQLNITSAGQIALNLDAKDGQQDGKIELSIWNKFWSEHCGDDYKGKKEDSFIEGDNNKYISVRNAMNAVMTRIFNAAGKLKKNVNDIGNEWLNNIKDNRQINANDVLKDNLSQEAEPPKKNKPETRTSRQERSSESTDESQANAQTVHTVKRGNKTYTVDKDGYSTTDCEGVFYKNGKHYKVDATGKMKEIMPYSNGRILQFYKDGSRKELCNVQNKGKDYVVVMHDKNGDIIKKTQYKNGKPYRTDKCKGVGELTDSEVRLHQRGQTVRFGKTVKNCDNGNYVCWMDDPTTGIHGYTLRDPDGRFLGLCDKDGNLIE